MWKIISRLLPCCTFTPFINKEKFILSALGVCSGNGMNFPMGAELSNPFAMSHGFPFALASACLSLAVKSMPTVTES